MIRQAALLSRLVRRLRCEAGVSLVIALGMSTVLGLSGTTAMVYVSQNQVSASRARADRSALSLAEAGLSYAYATIHNASDPTMPGAVPQRTVQLEGGTATYSGTLAADGTTWSLTGTGRVANPGRGADVMRVVRGRVRLGSATVGSSNNAIWNYVYADQLTGCTTLSNTVNVNIPLYVRGNLCLENSSQVSGYALQVGGTLTIQNEAHIGSPEVPLTEAHIGGGCTLSGGPLSSPCGPAQRVHATTVDAYPTGLTKPPVDLEGWYVNAKPGPRQNCTSGSFPGGFDNDTVLNRSLGEVNLAPAIAYDCQVRDGEGNLLGRIAWSPTTKVLTIHGTIFFDGDIVLQNLTEVVYQGKATIYAAGKIVLKNQSTLCGVAGCDESWNPMTNLLALVAGTPDDSGLSIDNYSKFQGAIYVVNDYYEGNNATVWGPIIARQVFLQNSTTNHYVPIGTLLPGMPATYEEAVILQNETGSWG